MAWLTLIIGGTFGLTITVITSKKSKEVLNFLNNSERKRQYTAKRTILNNACKIQQLSTFFFESIRGKQLSIKQKKSTFKTFLPKFNQLVYLSQNSTSSLGNLFSDEDVKRIEDHLKVLDALLMILEHGNEIQFETNIGHLIPYSKNIIDELNETDN